jgi:hypothetical protein
MTFQFPDMANIFPAAFLLDRFAVPLNPILYWDVDEELLAWGELRPPEIRAHTSLSFLREQGLYTMLHELENSMSNGPTAVEL